ncbi:uncharacterized protein M6D78_005592 [Vipera latastei]
MQMWVLFLPIFTSHLIYLNRQKKLGTLKPRITQKELEYARNMAREMLLLQLRKERLQDQSSSYNAPPPPLGDVIEGTAQPGGQVKRGFLLDLLCKQKCSKSDMSNTRPGGQIRPAKWFHAAREAILETVRERPPLPWPWPRDPPSARDPQICPTPAQAPIGTLDA